MKRLIFAALLLLPTIAIPALPVVKRFTWTNPTQNTDGSPLTDLTSIRLNWGSGNTTVPAAAARADVPFGSAGTYTATAVAINAAGAESAPSAAVQFTVANVLTTAEETVYSQVKQLNRFILLPVGKAPIGTPCIADQSTNGYYAVDVEKVTWSGTVRADVVVAKCH